MQKQNKKRAFTIIEILLILAIFILIISIILVNLSTVKFSAQRSAVMTELRTSLVTFESCVLSESDILCVTNPSGCDGTLNAKPLSNTSICFDSEKWPNVEKNGYKYAGHVGFDKKKGQYAFGVIRDRDGDNVSDDGNIICCSRIGCREQIGGVTDGSTCLTHAGL